ncbi:NAD(P)/FAD-dependent oxidoreductase [Gemmata sp.]|uniref:NAD(P)/FAD-dependent oxidoreductase n=1 Tax=Gemmata sp. TaxID=1914242 RepID=UPI003F709D39
MDERERPNRDGTVGHDAPFDPNGRPVPPTGPRSEPAPRVAVVGAGVAGLACARALTDRGFDLTVFDKGRGPGGRTATRRVDPDQAFDHGAQYFTARHPDFVRTVGAWLERGAAAEWGGRVVKLERGVAVDTPPQRRYVGVPGMSAVAAHLAAALAVRHGTRVARTARTPAGWQVVDESGGASGPFDFLVVALPSPQAAEVLAPHPFAAEAAGVPMAPCWAVLVAFGERLDVPWDGAFVSGSPLSWVARNSSKPGRPRGPDCWVLHAGAEWSAAHLEEPPAAVAPLLLGAFAAAAGRTLPPPVHRAAHRWRYSLGADAANRTTLFDAAGLLVCGDWLAGGRVEGAYLSGAAAAARIVRETAAPHLPAG